VYKLTYNPRAILQNSVSRTFASWCSTCRSDSRLPFSVFSRGLLWSGDRGPSTKPYLQNVVVPVVKTCWAAQNCSQGWHHWWDVFDGTRRRPRYWRSIFAVAPGAFEFGSRQISGAMVWNFSDRYAAWRLPAIETYWDTLIAEKCICEWNVPPGAAAAIDENLKKMLHKQAYNEEPHLISMVEIEPWFESNRCFINSGEQMLALDFTRLDICEQEVEIDPENASKHTDDHVWNYVSRNWWHFKTKFQSSVDIWYIALVMWVKKPNFWWF